MSTPPVTPEPIVQVCSGLWAAGVLKGAVELQLFDHIAAGMHQVGQLSQRIGAQPEALQVTLDALVALEFLEKGAQGYRLTPTSATFLVSSEPTYLGIFAAEILGDPILYDLYNNYRRVVTEGYRRDPWDYQTGSNDKVVRNVRQLFTFGYPNAQAIADHQGWSADNPAALRLLDVGCGSAVHGLVALSRLPSRYRHY